MRRSKKKGAVQQRTTQHEGFYELRTTGASVSSSRNQLKKTPKNNRVKACSCPRTTSSGPNIFLLPCLMSPERTPRGSVLSPSEYNKSNWRRHSSTFPGRVLSLSLSLLLLLFHYLLQQTISHTFVSAHEASVRLFLGDTLTTSHLRTMTPTLDQAISC